MRRRELISNHLNRGISIYHSPPSLMPAVRHSATAMSIAAHQKTPIQNSHAIQIFLYEKLGELFGEKGYDCVRKS
jgi:hypothetical protein